MSNQQTLSILGLYNYDSSIFDNMVLPDQVSKPVLIDNLITELAELELIYPSASLMRQAIGFWSESRIHEWSRIADLLYKDYNPFINIVRDETRTISEHRENEGSTVNKTDGNTTNYTNAWDDGSVQRDKDVSDFKTTQDTEDTGTMKRTERYHLEGDSAIRDAQDIIRLEYEVRTDFSIYRTIIQDFKNRFCIMVY